MSKLYMMVTITNKHVRSKFREFYKEQGLSLACETFGAGTARSELLDYLGMIATEKIIMFHFVTDDVWKKIRRDLIKKMYIDVPGMGIAFIIPLSSVGGRSVLQFLIGAQEFQKGEESVMKETEYELLVIIANSGATDNIMDIARNANAGGGTVIHAKGTGMEQAKKFLGVSLAEEREMIFIATKKAKKNQIMKEIMEKAGLNQKEKAIVFSLPVTDIAGMRILDAELED